METPKEFTVDQIIQYSVVGLVLLAAFGWMLWKIFRKSKKVSGGCCGCAIADSCGKKSKIEKTSCKDISEKNK